MTTESGGPRLVERAIDVLMALSDGPQTFTAVCRTVGLSKATVHRILSGLTYSDFVVHNPESGEYMLGPGSYRMARRFSGENGGLASLVRPVLSELWAQTQETVILHVPLGFRRVVVEELESPLPLRYTAGIGSSVPLHVGSAGKVLLAWLGEDQVQGVLPAGGLELLTEATLPNRELLFDELRTVRAQGWAESHGERAPGAFGVSAPIFGDPGHVVASISIIGPEARLTRGRFIELRRSVTDAALRATQLFSLPSEKSPDAGSQTE
jgi:DNA-binding IclR family transcriptional regulator